MRARCEIADEGQIATDAWCDSINRMGLHLEQAAAVARRKRDFVESNSTVTHSPSTTSHAVVSHQPRQDRLFVDIEPERKALQKQRKTTENVYHSVVCDRSRTQVFVYNNVRHAIKWWIMLTMAPFVPFMYIHKQHQSYTHRLNEMWMATDGSSQLALTQAIECWLRWHGVAFTTWDSLGRA